MQSLQCLVSGCHLSRSIYTKYLSLKDRNKLQYKECLPILSREPTITYQILQGEKRHHNQTAKQTYRYKIERIERSRGRRGKNHLVQALLDGDQVSIERLISA
jgi:hypothetical protein